MLQWKNILNVLAGIAISLSAATGMAQSISPYDAKILVDKYEKPSVPTPAVIQGALLSPKSKPLHAPIFKPLSASNPAEVDETPLCTDDSNVISVDSNIVAYTTADGTVHHAIYATTTVIVNDNYLIWAPFAKQVTYSQNNTKHDLSCFVKNSDGASNHVKNVLFCALPDSIKATYDESDWLTVSFDTLLSWSDMPCHHERVLAVKKSDCNTVNYKADGQNCPITLNASHDYTEGAEITKLLASLFGDTDQDGTIDGSDKCPQSKSGDTDKDGTCDDVDNDVDGDGVINNKDNCTLIKNGDQKNKDGDLLGDACDEKVSVSNIKDDDSDGLDNQHDNCPDNGSSTDQTDADGDGKGAPCDANDGDTIDEGKGTGAGEICENGTMVGNVCTPHVSPPDSDGDGFDDSEDNCPNTADTTNLCKAGPKLCATGAMLDAAGNCVIPDPNPDTAAGLEQGGGCSLVDGPPANTGSAALCAAGLAAIVLLRRRGRAAPLNRGALLALCVLPAAHAVPCPTHINSKITTLLVKYPVDTASTANAAALLVMSEVDIIVEYPENFTATRSNASLPCGHYGEINDPTAQFTDYYVCPTDLQQLSAAHTVSFTAHYVPSGVGAMVESCTFTRTVAATTKDAVLDATQIPDCKNESGCSLTMCKIAEGLRKFTIAMVSDQDKDGVFGTNDNCPFVSNADQSDTDDDGTGDVCELDDDGDGIINDADNCPGQANAEQDDFDQDNQGDTCDTDDDSDNILDADDPCLFDINNACAKAKPKGVCAVDQQTNGECPIDSDGDGTPDHSDICKNDATDQCIAKPFCKPGEITNSDGSCSLSKNTPDPKNNLSGGGGCSLVL